MRVIAGDYKGRKLNAPFDNKVRPTSDKVKEAIFSMLMHYLNDAVCVDLFAGTGGLGIEALSRGAKKTYFCDSSKESIGLVKSNIKMCQCSDYSVVFHGDFLSSLERIDEQVDIVFMDPPYGNDYYEDALEKVESLDLLHNEGIIVAEHDKRQELPERVGRLVKVKEKKYGTIGISLYKVGDIDVD